MVADACRTATFPKRWPRYIERDYRSNPATRQTSPFADGDGGLPRLVTGTGRNAACAYPANLHATDGPFRGHRRRCKGRPHQVRCLSSLSFQRVQRTEGSTTMPGPPAARGHPPGRTGPLARASRRRAAIECLPICRRRSAPGTDEAGLPRQLGIPRRYAAART